MKQCRNYVGVPCVNGSCPIANADEYEERCMDVIKKCEDCFITGAVMTAPSLGQSIAKVLLLLL